MCNPQMLMMFMSLCSNFIYQNPSILKSDCVHAFDVCVERSSLINPNEIADFHIQLCDDELFNRKLIGEYAAGAPCLNQNSLYLKSKLNHPY